MHHFKYITFVNKYDQLVNQLVIFINHLHPYHTVRYIISGFVIYILYIFFWIFHLVLIFFNCCIDLFFFLYLQDYFITRLHFNLLGNMLNNLNWLLLIIRSSKHLRHLVENELLHPAGYTWKKEYAWLIIRIMNLIIVCVL